VRLPCNPYFMCVTESLCRMKVGERSREQCLALFKSFQNTEGSDILKH
jgi:hypothetical protein